MDSSLHFTTQGAVRPAPCGAGLIVRRCDMYTFCAEMEKKRDYPQYNSIADLIKGETSPQFSTLRALFTEKESGIVCVSYALSSLKMTEILLCEVTKAPNTETYLTFQVGTINIKFSLFRTDKTRYSRSSSRNVPTISWTCDIHLKDEDISLKLLEQDGGWFAPLTDDAKRATSFNCLMYEIGRVFESHSSKVSSCAMLMAKNYPHLSF